ncbi:MAG: serine O-acetyltransferase [Defluviitaleaceae bacterium]|nr:serine O-acetyltransferase [Defluviitaleaceae bacterium]
MHKDREAWLYPGIWAMFCHRAAHRLYNRGCYFSARFISMFSRWMTGIEIHPGATIGRGVFIDHGMGVVIGETCRIGNNVLIYHGVTLGATGKPPRSGRCSVSGHSTGNRCSQEDKERRIKQRHPVIGDNVVIGASAIILGPIKVGDDAKIGAGALVISDVPDGATVVSDPARNIRKECSARTSIKQLQDKIEALEKRH